MHHDLFNYKAHTFETIQFLAILPDGIVVDFVHSINQAYLEVLLKHLRLNNNENCALYWITVI